MGTAKTKSFRVAADVSLMLPFQPIQEIVDARGGIQALVRHDTREARLYKKGLASLELSVYEVDELCIGLLGFSGGLVYGDRFYEGTN